MSHNPNELPPQNIVIAVAVSIAILIGFYFVFEKPRIESMKRAEAHKKANDVINKNVISNVDNKSTITQTYTNRDDILKTEENLRINFETEHLNISISRKGAMIDDVSFKDYYMTTDKKELVHLLIPEGTKNSYIADFGWMPTPNSEIDFPNDSTIWDIVENTAVANNPNIKHRVIFKWQNKQNIIFEKIITVDNHFMFTVTQKIYNNSDKNIETYPYGLLSRRGKPDDYSGFFVLHEGPVGFIDGELEELSYDEVGLGKSIKFKNKNGWIGISDKYWFTGIFPENPMSENNLRYSRMGTKGNEIYQTDIIGEKYAIAAGKNIEHTMRLFTGSKILDILQNYEKTYNIPKLELVIDFGMYYFLTKPLFVLLTWLGTITGHIGFGIIILTILLKLLTFPLSYKAYKSMAMVTKIQPQMKEIKEKYNDNRQKMQEAFLELYQKEGVNPFSGCWPMLIQIPIFFSLYKVILTNIMLRHQPFWGWIDDLSAKDPTSIFNLFGLLPYTPPDILIIGAWPCLMGLSMYMLNRMSPKPTDATQAMIKNYFPYLFTIMLAHFASGLVIYWTLSNLLTILQQYVIMRRMGVPISLIRGHLGHLEENKDSEETKDTDDKDKEETTEEIENTSSKSKNNEGKKKKTKTKAKTKKK